MKKVYCILLAIIFCLTMVAAVYAADNELVRWDPDSIESSDKEYMDLDVGHVTWELSSNQKTLSCLLENAYPGYEASVTADVENITDFAVTITGVEFVDAPPECIELTLTGSDNNSLLGADDLVIDKNGSLAVKLTTTVTEAAAQASTYDFSIKLTAEQAVQEEEEETGGYTKKRRSRDRDYGPVGVTPVVPQNFEPITVPSEPPVASPQELPDLPKTGAGMLMCFGIGAALGGIGLFFQRRK